MTVTLYRHNKVDQAEQHDPDKLAREFVATVRGEKNPEYKRSFRPYLDFEYRWFLSGPPYSFAWHEEDWPKLWVALDHLLAGDPDMERDVNEWLVEHLK